MPIPKFSKASKSAKSSWRMPAPRSMMATRSPPWSLTNSIDGHADGTQYLGMGDPKPASPDRLLDHPAGTRLGELHQACDNATAFGRHSRDLGRGLAIRRGARRA